MAIIVMINIHYPQCWIVKLRTSSCLCTAVLLAVHGRWVLACMTLGGGVLEILWVQSIFGLCYAGHPLYHLPLLPYMHVSTPLYLCTMVPL